MMDTVVVTAPAAAPAVAKSPAKKKADPKSKKPAASATHPTTAVMVTAAIKELLEKKGSSLPAIKKYLVANYKVDAAKLAPFIRKFQKAAVAKGVLVQTNGTGAYGHFKLAADVKKPAKAAPAKEKKSAAKKPKAAAGAPKKRKLTAKRATSEPASKKAKIAAAASKPKAAKKAPTTKTKPPKAKKLPAKKPAASPMKK